MPAEPVEHRFRRLMGLILAHAGGPPATLSEVTERFRCTRAVLERDLAAADGCGIPDYTWSDELITAMLDDGSDAWDDDDTGNRTASGSEPGELDEPVLVLEVPDVFLRRARLDEAEGLALLTAATTVLALRPDEALARGTAKLRDALGTEADLRVDVPKPAALTVFLEARSTRRAVTGRYWSAHRDAVTDRLVEPHVVFLAGGAWYARCVDRADGAVKLFRLDRFTDARTTDLEFHEVAVDASTDRFRAGPDTVTATVEFPASAAWVREELEVDITASDDEGFVARFPVVGTAWLATLLLRSDGRVVDPPELVEVAADAARRALANYA